MDLGEQSQHQCKPVPHRGRPPRMSGSALWKYGLLGQRITPSGTAKLLKAQEAMPDQSSNPEYDLLAEGKPVEHVYRVARYVVSSRDTCYEICSRVCNLVQARQASGRQASLECTVVVKSSSDKGVSKSSSCGRSKLVGDDVELEQLVVAKHVNVRSKGQLLIQRCQLTFIRENCAQTTRISCEAI